MSFYTVEAATGQHIGDRKEQQDRVALLGAPKAPGHMMAILADGMGGSKGGAMAAEQIIHSARQLMGEFSPLTHTVEGLLETVVKESHTIIKLIGMSANNAPHTTMVALMLTPDRRAVWGHAGDSRLYRFSGRQCAERTIDHSYVEMMVQQGKLTREEARKHHQSNLLVNGLGGVDEPYVTIGSHRGLRPGDSFLLCSDGLWQYFHEAELGTVIASNAPRQASESLIQRARERAMGYGDNCTLALVKLVESA